jgi:hypothetical protein
MSGLVNVGKLQECLNFTPTKSRQTAKTEPTQRKFGSGSNQQARENKADLGGDYSPLLHQKAMGHKLEEPGLNTNPAADHQKKLDACSLLLHKQTVEHKLELEIQAETHKNVLEIQAETHKQNLESQAETHKLEAEIQAYTHKLALFEQERGRVIVKIPASQKSDQK